MKYTIGIDVGGTFTDFLLTGQDGRGRIYKILSTPDDPSDAVFAGLAEIASSQDLTLGSFLAQVGRIVHGTTVTTNAGEDSIRGHGRAVNDAPHLRKKRP